MVNPVRSIWASIWASTQYASRVEHTDLELKIRTRSGT